MTLEKPRHREGGRTRATLMDVRENTQKKISKKKKGEFRGRGRLGQRPVPGFYSPPRLQKKNWGSECQMKEKSAKQVGGEKIGKGKLKSRKKCR